VRILPGQRTPAASRTLAKTVARGSWREVWESVRYGALLPWTARSRLAGVAYSRLCGSVAYRLDAQRRETAVGRIERWLGVDEDRARAIFRSTLRSEAREESDVSWLMNHPAELARAFRLGTDEPADEGPAIWATLHLGSPNLAFVYLRCLRGRDLHIVARPLDDTNPMPEAKRVWGHRKVAWIENVTGAPFLGTSAEAISVARSRLLKGASIFALIDVPGDIVSRSITLELFGERVRIAAGVFVLSSMLSVPVRPIVAIPRGGQIELRYGRAIEPIKNGLPTEAIESEITTILRDLPGEWWLWPYLPVAP